MLAAALAVMGLVLFGALTIVAGSLNFQTSSSRGGDAEQVVDAAEWGLNTLLEQLNEPAYQHLLVTPRDQWEISGNERAACGINTEAEPGEPDAITSGTREVGNLEVQYDLLNFVPPSLPRNAVNPCGALKPFANLNGGTARLTVEGRVLRDGVVIGRHTVVRDVTVVAETSCTGPDGPCSEPLAVLGTGPNPFSVNLEPKTKRDNGITKWRLNDPGDTPLDLYCIGSSSVGCEPLAAGSLQALYGGSPPVPANLPAPIPIITAPLNYFPYSIPSPNASTQPREGCTITVLPKPNQSQEEVVACRLSGITLTNSTLTVNTGPRPVVLYIMPTTGSGNVTLSTSGTSSAAGIVNSQFYSSTSTTTRSVNSTRWNRLQIYGDPRSYPTQASPACPATTSVCPTQPGSSAIGCWRLCGNARISGAAIWAPRELIKLENPTGSARDEYTLYGTAWAQKLEYNGSVRHLV
ncbi:MAG: hypothetical protein ACKOZN_10500, partial [Cyanobium sp.]